MIPARAIVIITCLTLAFSSFLCIQPNREVLGIDARVKTVGAAHPRLFIHKNGISELRRRIDSNQLLLSAYHRVVQQADELLGTAPLPYTSRERDRLVESRIAMKRISYLSFVYLMTEDYRYLKRARDEMVAVAAMKDWNPRHFLDVAEMTAAMAIGYDWLYDGLAKDVKSTTRNAIVKKGLAPLFSLRYHPWANGYTNWTQVCYGGLALGALSVMEDEPALATKVISRALTGVRHSMKEAYGKNGGYAEGPGYWCYGTTYNVLMIDALNSALRSDFGLTEIGSFMESARYFLHATDPTGELFNYGDCLPSLDVVPVTYWFASKCKQPDLLWMEKQRLRACVQSQPVAQDEFEALMVFTFLCYPSLDSVCEPARLHWEVMGRTPAGFHRSGWDPNATYVGIKGGSPKESHAHMDIGSFVAVGDGIRWAVDLGPEEYSRLESMGVNQWDYRQNSERWRVFRLGGFSHNILVVDARPQTVGGFAKVISFSDSGPMPHTVIDMSSVYQGQLRRAVRGVGLTRDRQIVVQDEIQGDKRPHIVRWGMLTCSQVEIARGNGAILRQSGKELRFDVLMPRDSRLKVYQTDPPPKKYDSRNPGTRMIGFETMVGALKEERIVVVLTPGESRGEPVCVRTLSDWP